MWAWSRNSECGRATEVAAMVARPAGIFRVAFSFGWPPRRALPRRRSDRFGLKSSLSQSVAANGDEGLAVLPRSECRTDVVSLRAHEVGFSEKSGRSRKTLAVR